MTQERFNKFQRHDQLLMIGSELERARVWQNKDLPNFAGALRRALELVILAEADPKWAAWLEVLAGLNAQVDSFLNFKNTGDVSVIYKSL